MSTHKHLVLLAGIALASTVAIAEESPNLGRLATPEEIAAYDIDASPDGSGLPPGSGTAKQGKAVYEEKCLGCHGPEGQKGPVMQLVGGAGTIGVEQKPLKTVGSFWPY